jgi:peptide/nickel transport system substrate-binding protein
MKMKKNPLGYGLGKIASLVLLSVVLAGGVFAGGNTQGSATGSQTSGTGASGPTTGGTLIIGEFIQDAHMAAKNPFFPANTNDTVLDLLYDHLMFFNPILGELEPELAIGYEWSSDFLTLTFTIRSGSVWHDGKPVTADDVAFTYNVLKQAPTTDRFSLWSRLSSVTAEGNKVIFKLSQTFTSLPLYTSDIYIVPKHIWEALPSIPEERNASPVGSGPFQWVAYNMGTDIQFKANKSYWRGAPKVDSFIIRIYNSSANLTLGLLRGDVHATAGTFAMPNMTEFLSKPNAKMQKYAGLNNYMVIMNLENEMLADPAVRRAMRMAINTTDLIVRGEYNGVFPTSIGFLPSLFGELQSENAKKPMVYDPAAAQKILTDAGYSKGQDGIYQKGGKRLSFTYHNASGAPAQQMEAGMIQQWLLNIGIEIIPRLATWAELTQLLQTGRYMLLQNGISFPADPHAALNTSFHSSRTAPTGQTTPGTNYFRYRNRQVDALLDEVSSVVDPAKQKELYGKIQDILIEDAPFLPMYNVGGHNPYYDGGRYSGWAEDAPIFSSRAVINIYENK